MAQTVFKGSKFARVETVGSGVGRTVFMQGSVSRLALLGALSFAGLMALGQGQGFAQASVYEQGVIGVVPEVSYGAGYDAASIRRNLPIPSPPNRL